MEVVETEAEKRERGWKNYAVHIFKHNHVKDIDQIVCTDNSYFWWDCSHTNSIVVSSTTGSPRIKVKLHTKPFPPGSKDNIPQEVIIHYDAAKTEYRGHFTKPEPTKKYTLAVAEINHMLHALKLPRISLHHVAAHMTSHNYRNGLESIPTNGEESTIMVKKHMGRHLTLAGQVANGNHYHHHLLAPELSLPRPLDDMDEMEAATVLSRETFAKNLTEAECIPTSLKSEWDRNDTRGHTLTRTLSNGFFKSDKLRLEDPDVFPRARHSFRNLIVSYNAYEIVRNDLGPTSHPKPIIPAMRDILGRHVPYPSDLLGEKHSFYYKLGTRNRVGEQNWPKEV